MAALKYWLWLTTAPALSNRAKLLLLEHFSSPEDVYYAQPDQLCLVEGITRQQAESLSDKSLARAEKVLADCARDGQFIVTMDDAAYPARLRDMYDPPVPLYGKGSMPLFDEEAAVATDLPVRRVLSALTMLEIDGYVCRQGAGSFLRTVELKEE